MNNKNHNIYLDTYSESAALQQLIQTVKSALNKQNEAFESDNSCALDQFTITVDGVQTAFVLGGPQTEALYSFIKHIASENMYYADIRNSVVSE